ncbi:hypothetical protein ABEB36_008863 [Hypothenemus hampei]|uniref:5'-nucleotidase n=1 Tax=Hypothenemus hampei TaxID=57062 RepID=A0ABD1ENR2_HYPHA
MKLFCLTVALWAVTVRGTSRFTRAEDVLDLIILHNNDMHGRFEETESNTGTCQTANRNRTCIGGMARTAHVIREFRKQATEGTGPSVLFLNAGDSFVGTAWFSVFTWNITSEFINLLEPDAISLGNHEFDLSVSTLATFLEHLNTPVIAANLNFSLVPSLQDKVKSSIVLDVSGQKIGIIGYLTPETIQISNTGDVIFEDEITALNREAALLESQGINIIIALGHSGYVTDQKIAREVSLVDLVIGGHTNTFLWNGDQPSTETVEDPYPKVITQSSGKKVPVVQAYAYTKYLGVLNCSFDSNGELVTFAGQPILMESSIPQEQDFLDLLEIYRPAIDALNSEIIGYTRVFLKGDTTCRRQECNLGNLITDALVAYALSESLEKWTNAPIGIQNGGGIRNDIMPLEGTGAITRGDLLAVLPFGNQIVVLTMTGSNLLLAIEQMVRSNGETSLGEFPQVSGLKLTLNMSKPSYSRVVSLKARCGICDIPTYEEVDPAKNYSVVTLSFLATGGDGVTVFKNNISESKTMDLLDVDVVANYITKYSPVYPELQGRIQFVESKDVDNGQSKTAVCYWLSLLVAIVIFTLT